MQALTLSLSPAGRGDENSALSTAPAGEEESSARLSEAKNFEDSYKTASSGKSETDNEASLESSDRQAKDTSEEVETEAAVQPDTLVESEKAKLVESGKTNALPAENELSLAKSADSSEFSIGALNNQEAISLEGEKSKTEVPFPSENKDNRVTNTALSEVKTNEVVLNTIKATGTPHNEVVLNTIKSTGTSQNTEINLASDVPPKNDPNASVLTKADVVAANASDSIDKETVRRTDIDKAVSLDQIKSKEETQLQLKPGNIVPLESEENLDKSRAESKITGQILRSDSEITPQANDITKFAETDSIKNVLDKQVDQKAIGKMDLLNGAVDVQSRSMGLQMSTGMEGGLALSPLASTTLSSTLNPSIQMISTNASMVATNFNAVSQAILVANETAKGVTVQLDPPEMGRVFIDFAFDADDKVNVVVKSDLPESHFMLRERSEQFLSILKESGLEDVNLSFEQNAQDGNTDSHEGPAEKPIYMSASSEETGPSHSSLQSISKDIETYDGLDLRL